MLTTDSVPSLESPSQDTFSILGHSICQGSGLSSSRLPALLPPRFPLQSVCTCDFHTFLLNPCSPLGVWTPMGFVLFYSQAQAQHRFILCTGLGL